ncbi:hypothetical protein [Streptomyces sp. MA5143a]|uniref:hypothetical protein n=1 Tax=Streptomyces sp. MA5143a TaxID=2083010 RepID=UPI000D2E2641|nr:hypothetical protein [Streptomyces sp. MA5143a]SPF06980.1 hypothetical protein SMA5143A_7824 [Streptomyces sp. MA5143a]
MAGGVPAPGGADVYRPVAPLGVWAAVPVAVAVRPREAEDADDCGGARVAVGPACLNPAAWQWC